MGKQYCNNKFITELYKRASKAPIKERGGSRFLAVDLRDTSREFTSKAALFLEDNPEIFRVLVRGPEIYVELVGGRSLVDAYEKICNQGRDRLN